MRNGPTVDLCLAGRDLTEPRPSPDGRLLVFVARLAGGSAQFVLVPTAGGPERILATAVEPATGRGRNGGAFCWLPDGSALLFVGADGGLWRQPVPSGPGLRVADLPGHLEGPVCSPDGSQVVVTLDRGSVWAMATTGEGRPRRLDDGRHDFCLDPVVTGSGSETRVIWQGWSVPDMPWDRSDLVSVTLAGDPISTRGTGYQVQQPSPLADGRLLSLRDDTGWLNLWLDDEVLIEEQFEHGGPTWGPGQRSFAVSPDGTMVAFTRNEDGFGRLCVLNLDSREVHDVARGVHGQLHWAPGVLTALRSGARTPTQVVAYSTTGQPSSWERTVLAVGPAAGWEGFDLPEPENHIAIGPAGMRIPFRRYGAGNGRAIINIHGGPTDQWQVEFLPRIAYWWSRGWDVIVPDPRGSTGFGRDHTQSLRGGWGRDDVDDVLSVIRHSHAAQWSSPSATVVMGSSSGGMAALGVAIAGKELIAGCIALYPVTEPADLAERSHRFEAHYTLGLIGPDGDPAYLDRSILRRAAEIDVPVLLMHGSDDPVVPVQQSRDLAATLEGLGRHIEFEEFPGEGHGFRQPANRRAEFRLVGQFLDERRRESDATGSSLNT